MSFRIVNQDTLPREVTIETGDAFFSKEKDIDVYDKADTTEITPDWRPEDYINPYARADRPLLLDDKEERIFEQGFKACLEALGRVK